MALKKKKKKAMGKKKKGSSMAAKIREKAKKQLKKRVKEDSKRSAGFGGANYLTKEIKYKRFDPKPGEDYLIDIIPFEMGDKCPINLDTGREAVPAGEIGYNIDFWVHKNIGVSKNQSVVCPEKSFGRPCPICDHKRELIAAGRDIEDEKWQELSAKRRNLYNVICYEPDQTDQGVQVWDVTFHWMQKHLMKLVKGPVRGKRKGLEPFISFSDPSAEGRSISFSIEKPKSKEAFQEYIGHRFETRDYDIEDDILESAIQLDQLLIELSYKDIYELYFDEPYEEGSKKKRKTSKPKKRGRTREEEPDEDEEEYDDEEPWEDDDEGDEEEYEEDEDEEEYEEDEDEEDDEDEVEVDECPEGYEFGEDYDLYDECEECDVRSECKAKKAELKKSKKGKKKATKKGKKSTGKKKRKR